MLLTAAPILIGLSLSLTSWVVSVSMGLVKDALGELGKDLATLAAKDYFFDDPLRRAYFENFTNLLPIDRHGSRADRVLPAARG